MASGLHLANNAILDEVLRAGVMNIVAQFAELEAGMINEIQLTQILASMAGAGLGEALFPDIGKEALSVSKSAKIAAQSVMSGFIDDAIEGRPVNVQNIFVNLLQAEGKTSR